MQYKSSTEEVSELSEEGYKLTITLSKKALVTLETLKEMSGFGSRGRTIEEAILTIWDMAEILDSFNQAYLKASKSGKQISVNMLNSYYITQLAKLARFGSPSEFRKKAEK